METPKISDMMVPLKEYAAVSAEASVRDAIIALENVREKVRWRRFKHRAVLVREHGGRIIGKIRPAEVLDNMSVGAAGKGGLDEMCRNTAEMPVRQVMHPFFPDDRIPVDAPIEEALAKMKAGRLQSLLVVENGEVVGVLRLTDLFTEVSERILKSVP